MDAEGGGKKRVARSGARRFAYRLAAKLGHVNVDRMLACITIRQFEEWRSYHDLEPFDEERADFRSAQIVQAIVNGNRGRGMPPIRLADCLLPFGKDAATAAVTPTTTEQTVAEVARTMEMLMLIHNGPQAQGN